MNSIFFGEGASEELAIAVRDLHSKGGLIFDLRDNQGGLLEEAIVSASIFLESGSVVLQHVDWDGQVSNVRTDGEHLWHSPVVLLVNQGTVGPAEMFVAALQTHQVGKSVGTETAGNAGMPSFHELGSELVLQLTDQTMRGPLGEVWAGRGLVPDVRVEPVGFALQPRPEVGTSRPSVGCRNTVDLTNEPSSTRWLESGLESPSWTVHCDTRVPE